MTDLTIIGGGAAGCHAAALAAKAGFSVILMESDALGGCAAHSGYWPYRHLLADAALLGKARSGILGMSLRSETNVYLESVERMRASTEAMVKNTRELLSSLGVNIVRSSGHVGGLRNHRYMVSAGGSQYESRRLLLCTGSIPAIPDLPGIDKACKEGFVTSPRKLLSTKPPMKALLAGGTLRDLKIAAWLAANKVSVVFASPNPRIVEEFDAEICDWLTARFEGVQFMVSSAVTSLDAQRATVTEPRGGRTISCDRVIMGGRRFPATRGIGLSGAAIATDDGAVITDLTGHTNLPDVYAAGDVNMRTQSALGAIREAEVCVSNMLGKRSAVDYNAIPYIFDCGLKAACVGLSETVARAMGYHAVTSRCCLSGNPDDGFVKVVADGRSGKLIGAHMCGTTDGIESIWMLSSLLGSTGGDAAELMTPSSEFAEAAHRALLLL